ncbi:hypothetical protein GCM10012285_03340 [Streptomyces kronopolitis]|uniref:Uncharacterized protein n=1 Tax=Streptomyces kronopolitis TaxID=1612435 RepID=A0ABQ2IZZ7_9ACTN|nr:hypothetical protein [Streptomyces kronopolitis]GGN32857.1 hypothetical protein GCM10012285_03340 [Streptomyces kronopolitis]
MEPLRSADAPSPKWTAAPTVRQVVGGLTRHPDNLVSSQQLLKRLVVRCTELGALTRNIGGFASTMTNLDGHLLPSWITATEQSELPPT